MCKSVDRLLSQMWYKTVSSCKRQEIPCTKCQMAEWFNSMETNFIIRPRSRKRRRRKKEMTNKVIPRTAASRTPLLAIKKMWPKYNLLRIKYMMTNLIMKLINSIIIRIQKNKTQIIPRPIRIQNVIEQFRKAHIFLVRILHFIVKFSFSEKATEMWRPQKCVQLSLWFWYLLSKCQNYKDDCSHFCGLLRKAELYLIMMLT